jgi:hypothetical protein
MRLPFPERIPLHYVVLTAAILAALQQLQGTSLTFSIFSFLFIVIAAITFNVAGGFTRPSGAYVFFYSALGLMVGLFYKAYLSEPADSNLRNPTLTIQVFTGGISAMLIAVIISKKISRKKAFLTNIVKEKDMKNAAVGCFTVGLMLYVIRSVVPHENGTVLSAVGQLDRFLEMSIILGTIHRIKQSGGRTGFSPVGAIALALTTFAGAVTFGKEGMFTPLLCWMIAACSMRLRIRLYQIGVGLVIVYVMFHYLVPYSQWGRTQVPENATLQQRMELSVALLSDLNGVRDQYLAGFEDDTDGGGSSDDSGTNMNYYNESQGFFDRLTMIGPDDVLIDYTSRGNYYGINVIPAYFANWIPHFLWPDKPGLASGNLFAHEIGGIVADDDYTTGISFTASGEAFHLAGWAGIFVIAPLVWIIVFTVFDSLCGDTRRSPWGLLSIALFAHTAPEGMLGGAVYITWFGSLGIIFVALACAYIMPLVGTLIAGPEKTGLVLLRKRGIPSKTLPPTNPARLSV